jgi:enamine deaminase RidA (YjgF/YER057c/UK114 family)
MTMPSIKIFNPEELGAPLGLYRQIARVRASELILIAGQLAVDRTGQIVGRGSFAAQMNQVFSNIEAGLRSVGCQFSNVIKFTTYLVHSQDIEHFMEVRKKLFPKLFANEAYPPNTLLIVDRLVREEFLIEVETVAAL